MTRAFAAMAALLFVGLIVLAGAPRATGQSDWVTLLDGKNMGDWDRVGDAN